MRQGSTTSARRADGDRIARRTLLAGAVIAAGAIPGTRPGPQSQPDCGGSLRFGFTGAEVHDASALDDALSQLEEMAALGARVVRCGIGDSQVLRAWGTPAHSASLAPSRVSAIHRVFARARELGMEVWMMLIVSYPDQEASEAYWRSKTEQWWRLVAEEFAREVAVVQIFNEADGSHYRFHTAIEEADRDSYYRELADLLAAASDIFHAVAPYVQVTTNLSGWPSGERVQSRWERALDVIAPSLDLVSVDIYFDHALDEAEIPRFPARMGFLRSRYGKPVAIAEIGDPTQGSEQKEEAQQRYYAQYVRLLRDLDLRYAVFYQYRDRGSTTDAEATFGIVRADGTPKPAHRWLADHPLPWSCRPA